MIEACHFNQSIKNHDGVDDRHQDINNVSDDDSNRCSSSSDGDISQFLSQHKIPISSFEAIRSAIKTIKHLNINQSDIQNNFDKYHHSQDEEKGDNNNEVKYSIKHLSPLVSQLKLLIS